MRGGLEVLLVGGASPDSHTLSDARMRMGRGRDDVPSYENPARGQRGARRVSRVHLPRAALRVALASRTVESIEAFKKAFPTTEIPAEVQAARQTALAAELAQARSEGTFTALFGFAEKYPDHGLGPDLEAGKKALYARAPPGTRPAPRPWRVPAGFVLRAEARAAKVDGVRGRCGVRFGQVLQ